MNERCLLMPVITLTSDWGLHDHYLAAVKGKILATQPGIQIIDLNHSIEPFNLAQAAFILRNAYRQFPAGTVHMVCVNAEITAEQECIAMHSEGHFFVAADNGLPGLLFDDEQKVEYARVNAGNDWQHAFPELEVFVPAACTLAETGQIEKVGGKTAKVNLQVPFRPAIDEAVITGSVIYIDSYQNAITNISRSLFDRIGKGRKFEIFIKSNHYRLSRLNDTYRETPVGELLALFNSAGLLEIAINNGNAASLLGLENGSVIRIKFHE